ncbi:MAG: phosphate ABC transporter permease subunit PstC [Chloroflexi bacterium]|nr:phosphate ABC transporter permease subunit PstC [Chloroflexota bacterium]
MTVIPGARQIQSTAPSARWTRFIRHGDIPFNALTVLASLSVLAATIAIGFELWQNSALPRAQFGLDFLTGVDWDPVTQVFGALPFIYGTLQTSFLALVLALPVGLGIAIFLAELAPDWLRQPLGFLVELLAAVPSVVYGLWGLFVFVPVFVQPTAKLLNNSLGFIPLFDGPVFGPSRFAASLILAIMILPTISSVSRDVFMAIPRAQREASLALGATQWETIGQVLIPYGLSGILGAVILGLGRALGETIAVTMVIGNNLDLSASILHPGYTMASIIANEFTEATYDLYIQSLIEIALVLFAITLVLNVIARFLVWRVARRVPTEARV